LGVRVARLQEQSADFIVIPKAELLRRMAKLHESDGDILQCYLSSTESGQCWETRGLRNEDWLQIINAHIKVLFGTSRDT